MSYKSIDPIITVWATKHNLIIYTTYRDEEVRSVDLIGSNGHKCQLWIDTPESTGKVQIHVWDYKKRKHDYKVAIDDLPRCLEEAYETAMKWLNESRNNDGK
jgi:hypothetical protein